MADQNAEHTFDGIHLVLTGDRQLQFDYKPSDMEVVFRRTQPGSWDDMISWLEQHGTNDNELTPGEVVAMVEDLRSAKEQGTQFVDNPDKAYQEVHRFRGDNNQKNSQLHDQIKQSSAQGPKADD